MQFIYYDPQSWSWIKSLDSIVSVWNHVTFGVNVCSHVFPEVGIAWIEVM